jgi:hypothetical protein
MSGPPHGRAQVSAVQIVDAKRASISLSLNHQSISLAML